MCTHAAFIRIKEGSSSPLAYTALCIWGVMVISCDVDDVLRRARERAIRASKTGGKDAGAFSAESSSTGLGPLII